MTKPSAGSGSRIELPTEDPRHRRYPRRVDSPRRIPRRSPWRQRLVELERGVVLGFRADGSLHVLLFGSAIAIVGGLVLGLSLLHWSLVLLAITVAFVAGMFHQVVKAVCHVAVGRDDEVARGAIRMGAVAVWFATLGGALVIGLAFYDHLRPLFTAAG